MVWIKRLFGSRDMVKDYSIRVQLSKDRMKQAMALGHQAAVLIEQDPWAKGRRMKQWGRRK